MKHSHVLRVHDCETRTILLPMMTHRWLKTLVRFPSSMPTGWNQWRYFLSTAWAMHMCGDVTHFLNIFCSVPTDCVAVRGFVEQDSFFTFMTQRAQARARGTTVHAHKSLSKLWRVEKMSDVTMTRPTLNKIEQIRSQRSCASWGRVHLKVPNYRRVVFSESACKNAKAKARSKASVISWRIDDTRSTQ